MEVGKDRSNISSYFGLSRLPTGVNMDTNANKHKMTRTTIGIKKSTKDKLDRNRSPGQCYDGFICQLVDLWEKSRKNEKRLALRL